MSFVRFRPQIWAAVLLQALEKSLVYAAPGVVNRDYEGEIADAGDTVKITSISDPSIGDYVPGTPLVRETLTDAQRNLVIDQAKYFDFEVDDIDKRQAKGNVMPEALRRAAYKLKDIADQYVASFYTQINLANRFNTGTAVGLTSADDAYDLLVDLGVLLDEKNIMSEGRYAIAPPWFHGLIAKDPRFTSVADSGSDETLRNGTVGRIAGFTLKKSNNCPNPTGDDFVIQAGVDTAISYAEQINKVVPFSPEDSFGDAMKGLHLYGAKMIRPDHAVYALGSRTAP